MLHSVYKRSLSFLARRHVSSLVYALLIFDETTRFLQ